MVSVAIDILFVFVRFWLQLVIFVSSLISHFGPFWSLNGEFIDSVYLILYKKKKRVSSSLLIIRLIVSRHFFHKSRIFPPSANRCVRLGCLCSAPAFDNEITPFIVIPLNEFP